MKFLSIAVMGLVLLSTVTTFAQTTESGVVTGAGSVGIERTPETMRINVALLGKGGTLKDALASLKKRTEAAREQLADLGAEKESIKVDAPRIQKLQNDRQRQMEMMMMARMKRGSKASSKTPAANPITVTATLTAEWKLDAKDAEALLLAVHPLQEKIRAADLAGTKDVEKLTPEQEEMLEEAEASGFNRYGGGEEAKPGEPVFLFVARVSDEDHAKALSEAFQKAKAQAAKLAKAAGTELGALKSLSNQDTQGLDDGEMGYAAYPAMYSAMRLARALHAKSDTIEAVGADPGPVKYNVVVSASFDVKGK